jgi:hypothetical protein
MQWTVFVITLLITVLITIINLRYPRGKEKFLCGDCKFNNPDECLKKERPHAIICTSYRERSGINQSF